MTVCLLGASSPLLLALIFAPFYVRQQVVLNRGDS